MGKHCVEINLLNFNKLVVLFYGVSALFRSFNVESNHFDESFKVFVSSNIYS